MACALALFPGFGSFVVASIHAPIIKNRVFPHLANIFEELETTIAGRSALIGGDLNSARLAEKLWPGYGHGTFFERIDRGDIWVDCCRLFHPHEIQTYFRKNLGNTLQDDYIFVSPNLKPRVRSCEIINNEQTRNYSDHVPVVVEVELDM